MGDGVGGHRWRGLGGHCRVQPRASPCSDLTESIYGQVIPLSGGSYRSLGTAGNFFGQLVCDLFELGITVAVYDVVHPDVMRCGGPVWGRLASTRLSRSTAVRRYGYPGAQFDVGDLR
jgi:hypothetical protein